MRARFSTPESLNPKPCEKSQLLCLGSYKIQVLPIEPFVCVHVYMWVRESVYTRIWPQIAYRYFRPLLQPMLIPIKISVNATSHW